MFKLLGILLTTSVLSFSAFGSGARSGEDAQSLDSSVNPFANRSMSLEDLKEACTDPLKLGLQRPPQNIQLICNICNTDWVKVEDQQKPMDCDQTVRAKIFTDKGKVSPGKTQIASVKQGSCPVFKEIITIRKNVAVPLTCAQILDHKGSIEDFCIGKVGKTINDDVYIDDVTDTGRFINTCTSPQVQKIGGQEQSYKTCDNVSIKF